MEEYKEGELRSRSGKAVTDRKHAVAIALNDALKTGAKIPRKTGRSRRRNDAETGNGAIRKAKDSFRNCLS